MDRHIELAGLLHVIWGAIAVLLGVSVLLLAAGAIAIAGAGMHGAPDVAAAFTAAGLTAAAIVLLVGGAANAWAGVGLRRHRPAARIMGLGLALLNLFVLPFGTALGVYTFWVLLNHEARARFEPAAPGPSSTLSGGIG
ncbi:MAG TPA: hypothetical protein VK886_13365 [Vicinamibacterales bacterium]|nr:hypothetical protein [Vicinamibacterales bacterium]